MRSLACILGAAATVAIGMTTAAAIDLYVQSSTGDPQLDALRWPLIYGALRHFMPVTPAAFQKTLDAVRALLVIAHQERSFDGAIGDTDNPDKGPSLSPWQLSRDYAKRLQLVPADTDFETYRSLPASGASLFRWGHWAVVAWDDTLAAVGGDEKAALGGWNGGPNWRSSGAASNYHDEAVATADAYGWLGGAA